MAVEFFCGDVKRIRSVLMKLLIANSETMVLRSIKMHLACQNDIEILGLIIVLMSDATTRQIKASCSNA